MIALSQQALRGPNYWSHNHPNLIQIRLLLEGSLAVQAEPEKQLLAFIKLYLPDFELDEGMPNRVLSFTAALALSLQKAVGCPVSYWAKRPTAYPTIFNLVVAYEFEAVGRWAVDKAVDFIHLAETGQPLALASAVSALKDILAQEKPSLKIASLLQLANAHALPVLVDEAAGILHLGYGIKSVVVGEETPFEDLEKAINNGSVGRIPILAVTGSNGKTTTTRLLAHILKTSGKTVGYTTSDGIYIQDEMVDEGDTTGPVSAQLVLGDKRVQVAVLETARGGILRAGLGFDSCDLAVVTNVQDDHLGISDIETLDQLAQVKEVLVSAVKPGGWAILNAANPYTVAMGEKAHCATAWFSVAAQPAQRLAARSKGGSVAYIEKGQIVVETATQKQNIAALHDVPITFQGTLGFMVENALAATLAAATYGVAPAVIAAALQTFYPSVVQTPGRMNIFELQGSKLLVDFAHNPDGFAGIRDFLATIQSPLKIGIIVGTGDRKEEDTRELGRISAQMFDVILIHQTKFLRSRTAESLVDLLVEGIHSHNPDASWQRIPDALEPLAYALAQANPGSYITALSEVLSDVSELVARYR